MGIRKRVTSAARRWVSAGAPEIAAWFNHETAATVMARLAGHETQKNFPREVVRWLVKELISFASMFGDYISEDPSSFCLSTNFSLYPQFMYHLRRSQVIEVFNSSPDETAFFQLMLNPEGVMGSLIMIQLTIFLYSFDGPPIPVLLVVCSLSPDVIMLFDSYFYVVIHYGSKTSQWKKMGYDRDPNHESFRKLLEAPAIKAEQLVAQRIRVPKLVKCEQHSSQARFLLAKLNPLATHKSSYVDGFEVIMTDDVSLQVFLEHLQELAVQVVVGLVIANDQMTGNPQVFAFISFKDASVLNKALTDTHTILGRMMKGNEVEKSGFYDEDDELDETEYKSDDDSDYQSDKSVDYLHYKKGAF
ncbi:protein transport protein Sec23 [Tanacetum coccineum]